MDNMSIVKEISESTGVSTATINNKAVKLGFKLKGRTEDQHTQLMNVLATVKPRKRGAKKPMKKAKGNGKQAAKKQGNGLVDKVAAYVKGGDVIRADINARLEALETEQISLIDALGKIPPVVDAIA